MAENKRAAEAATEGGATNKPAPSFTVDRLRADCRKLFGVSTSTFDGATTGLEGKFTVEEMKNHINSWLNKPIGGQRKKEGK